jgi:hypothetical protein
MCLANLAATRGDDVAVLKDTSVRLQLLDSQQALSSLRAALSGGESQEQAEMAGEQGGQGGVLDAAALAAAALALEARGAAGRGAVLAITALCACPADVRKTHR